MHASPANSLHIILEGLNLEKYSGLFEEKKIKLDTLANMTEEDLIHIGIDEGDRAVILRGVEPLKNLYKDINEMEPPNLEAILANNLHHLKPLLGMMILIKKMIRKTKPENILLDSTHSASNVILQLLSKVDDELTNLKEDLIPGKIACKRDSVLTFRNSYIVLSVAAVAITSWAFFKYKKL